MARDGSYKVTQKLMESKSEVDQVDEDKKLELEESLNSHLDSFIEDIVEDGLDKFEDTEGKVEEVSIIQEKNYSTGIDSIGIEVNFEGYCDRDTIVKYGLQEDFRESIEKELDRNGKFVEAYQKGGSIVFIFEVL